MNKEDNELKADPEQWMPPPPQKKKKKKKKKTRAMCINKQGRIQKGSSGAQWF